MKLTIVKYRLVKFGRHLVSGSVGALAGGALLMATAANATDYFNSYVTGVTYTDGGASVEARSNASSDTTRLSTDVADDVVFIPSRITSTYTGVDGLNDNGWNGNSGPFTFVYDQNNNDSCIGSDTCGRAAYNTVTAPTSYTLTFAAGAQANDIYKTTGTDYSVNFGVYATSNLATSSYTANLVFNGTNIVSGFTDIDAGNITIAGGPVTFAGTVESGNIAVNGGDVSFSNNVSSNMSFGGANQASFQGGADLTGNIDFSGYNGTVRLSDNSNINGTVTTSNSNTDSGIIQFAGNGSITGNVGATDARLRQIDINGNNSTTVVLQGMNYVNVVSINTAGNLIVGTGDGTDGIDTTGKEDGRIDFNNTAGTVTIRDNASVTGNIVSTGGTNATSASRNNVVSFDGTSTMTGNIGTSASNRIALVNIGNVPDANDDTVSMNGDIFATTVNFNDNDILSMASGKNVTAVVTTDVTGEGVLTLVGGAQTVSGSVGTTGLLLAAVNSGANSATSNFSNDVFAVTVSNTGTGTTNFATNVDATTINVANGISNFTNNVTATTTNIGTGTGNFNTNGTGTTSSNIAFNDAGTANLNNGITGNIAYTGNNATVNVSSGKTVTGVITTTTNGTGYLNMLGGTQAVTGTVGSNGSALNIINAGADGAVTSFSDSTAQVFANTLNVTGNGTVNLDGGFAGTLAYLNNVEGENGTVNIAAGKNLTGAVTSTNSSDTNTDTVLVSQGILNFGGGAQIASGQIGANGSALSLINVGNTAVSTGTTFNGMVYADTLKFNKDSDVVTLNGGTGLQGTADLNAKNATLHIGDGVNLTVASNAIQFNNAESATLTFDGSSTVTNALGGGNATSGNSTFNTINAGVAGETVTFTDNVTVGAGNMNVTGTGTVNLQGDLTGALAYAADGVVNVSNGKSISGTVTTGTTNEGTLNFLGKTTLDTYIGESSKMLKAVTFNSASNNITQTIDKNIYATDVTIGGNSGTTAITKQAIAGTYDFPGATQMSEFIGGTTANVTNNIALGGNLNLANATTALNVGTSHITVGNNVVTNGGAMSFTVNTQDVTGVDEAASTSTGSGRIAATGNLTMTGAEKVHVNYVGSLANSGTYNLIESTGGTTISSYNQTEGAFVSDNSFAIDSRVYTNDNGDLIVAADRTGGGDYAVDQLYANKSNTVGHFSNNAASVLSGIAAAGSQTGDMVQVIQKLEIDSYGYGNTAENLASQVKKLAPIVNNSMSQSTFAATSLPTTTIGNRMANLRGDLTMSAADGAGTGMAAGGATPDKGVWVKLMGAVGDQDARKGYDGYTTNTWGLIIGADKKMSDKAILGVALSGAMTNVDQQDFRAGDKTKINTYQLTAYGSYDITKQLYVDGSVSLGKADYDGDRKTAIGRTASANYSGTYESVNLGAGYRINMGDKKVLTPMVAVSHTSLHNDGYTEKGADALNLSVDKQNLERTRAGLGLRFTNQLETAGGTIYRPEISAMVNHDFGNVVQNTTASYAGDTTATNFVTPNSAAERDSVTVGAGVTVLTSKNSSVQVRYDVEKRDSYLGQGGSIAARWEF